MADSKNIKPTNFSLKGFILVTRFWNLLIIVFAQFFTAIYLSRSSGSIVETLTDIRLLLLALSSVLIAAAGYIINDYYDVKIDLINKPHRVVVGRILKRRVAMVAHTILNFMGISIGFLLSWQIGIINFLSALILWLYSNQLKRIALVGNVTVAVLTGLSIYIINVLYQELNYLVIAYALFAFTFTLIREIIKDMEDVKGDLTFGCRTFPVVYGLRNTKVLLYIIEISFVIGLAALAYAFLGFKMMTFSLLLIIPLGFLTYKLYKADTTRHFNLLSNYCKVVMLIGILSMVIY
ncbi:prenyltransferase [Fulvivirga sp. RKSG066]|uniref:geranylgeranylglycerol-phosphate geranylgeranyltransferase n=1 Tax=Fulvivirga aurantia TaxID=2529383 RepID=UPI0012BD66AE|nr:geranylgeranylglycerol-phosphate geranylgeranyltransferase [Fulvivirga aurantia]MTI21995.1 prenyltransferase [Fulvivirga aurantia]